MALPNIFSRRKREAAKTGSDVYQYEKLEPKLRVQIIQILQDTVGYPEYSGDERTVFYNVLVKTLRKEIGVFELQRHSDSEIREFFEWFLNEGNLDYALDGIELSCRLLDTYVRGRQHMFAGGSGSVDRALDEINARMKEAGFGFEYNGGDLMRVDSQFIHREAVLPALALLSGDAFASANTEFREAHRQYREGRYEQCLVECCKAFESVLKAIAARRRWGVRDEATAKILLDAAFQSELVPPYLQSEFTSLRGVLESGIPTVRNRGGGHGAGTTPRNIPQHLAAFQLHQTASAIVFLAEADAAKP